MTEAMSMQDAFGFEAALAGVLRERRASAEAPAGLEQRLLARLAQEDAQRLLARLAQQDEPRAIAAPFRFAEAVKTPRSALSTWFAIGAHVAVAALLLLVATQHAGITRLPPTITAALVKLPAPPLLPPARSAAGGGGGQHDLAPVSAGHLPRLATEQLLAPKAPPTLAPKLMIEPSVVVDTDLKMADSHLPNMGDPTSTLKGFSMGNGSGTGLGSGNGSGIGTGLGGNTGGGIAHIGGSVLAPKIVVQVEPEFSEEARKAKFSGNVLVGLIVDAHGNATHVHVVRGVGLGLDEKAAEAVRQYKFKPATQNGKPVDVDLTIDVNFQIY